MVYFKNANKCHESISEYLLSSIKSGKLVDSAEREVSLNNTIILFSISLTESDDKLISKGGMGFSDTEEVTTDKYSEEKLEKVVSKELLNSVDKVIPFENLSGDDINFVYDNNVDSILSIYNDVDIDKDELKKKVFEKDCKNGHDVVNQLVSIVPKMIFDKVSDN